MPVPREGSNELKKVTFDNGKALAYNNGNFLISLYGLLCEVSGQENQNGVKNSLMQEAMKRNNVTIEEAIEGFWGAFSDPYVKDGDIQWRHIWKHVEKHREHRPEYYQPEKPYNAE